MMIDKHLSTLMKKCLVPENMSKVVLTQPTKPDYYVLHQNKYPKASYVLVNLVIGIDLLDYYRHNLIN